MKNYSHQHGSAVAIILVVALLAVLVLLWQTGRLGSVSDADTQAPGAATETFNASPDAGDVSGDAATDSPPTVTEAPEQPFTITNPNRELTAGEQAAIKAKNFKPQGTANHTGSALEAGAPPQSSRAAEEAAAIDAAAAELLSKNTPDFSSCRSIDAPDKALECAAAEQTRALNNAFKDHNAKRASGDSISIARGGKIMQQVITTMQERLAPFVAEAESP